MANSKVQAERVYRQASKCPPCADASRPFVPLVWTQILGQPGPFPLLSLPRNGAGGKDDCNMKK